MKIAGYCFGIGKDCKLFDGRYDIGEDHAEDGELGKNRTRYTEAMGNSCTAIMADEHDADRRIVGCEERFVYCSAIGKFVMTCFCRSRLPIAWELEKV